MAGGKHILGKTNARRVFGTAKVGDRGQIVIPKEARELFQIQPGDTLLVIGQTDAGILISRPDALQNLANTILEPIQKED